MGGPTQAKRRLEWGTRPTVSWRRRGSRPGPPGASAAVLRSQSRGCVTRVTDFWLSRFLSLNICLKNRLEMQSASDGRGKSGVFCGTGSGKVGEWGEVGCGGDARGECARYGWPVVYRWG